MNYLNTLRALTVTILLQCSHACIAGCSSSLYNYSATIPATSISVPMNKTPGPIGNVISLPAGQSVTVSCSGGGNFYTMLRLGTPLTPSSYSADIYETNVPGIGVKFWDDFSGTVIIGNDLSNWYFQGASSWHGGNWLTNVKMQFYIIGPVTPGTVNLAGLSVESWLNNSLTTSGGANYNRLNIQGLVPVTVAACETPDITVKLNSHASSEFPTVGSTSSEVPFNFEMKNCDAGINTINYTFTPGPGINIEGTGTSQALSLSSDSTASGLGIQMLYKNGDLVPLKTKTKFTGYSGAGDYTIPMKARYIRTGNIQGGTANSSVEFTMTYE